MKIKFLGTGASQGIPSPFCKCRICENARILGNKEIRSRSGLMIDREIMIDYSPDNFFRAAINSVDFTEIKYFLISHGHYDHFEVKDLVESRALEREWTGKPQSTYFIYGNKKVCSILETEIQRAGTEKISIQTLIEKNKPIAIGKYSVVALKTEHTIDEDSYAYLIEKDGKSYFHCCDSGELTEEIFDYLKSTSVKLNAVTFDATFGLRKEKFFGHMNLEQVVLTCDKLRNAGIIFEGTKIYLTHISHSGRCTHEELVQSARKYGMEVAYDGLEFEI